MKSAVELAMEKSKKISGEEGQLSEEQKKEIAAIRNTYKAKMAEAEILLKEEDVRGREIARLQRECESKIQTVYKSGSKSRT